MEVVKLGTGLLLRNSDDGVHLYAVHDGVVIAERGQPDTPQAKQWIALKPGYVVHDVGDGITVTLNGVLVKGAWLDDTYN